MDTDRNDIYQALKDGKKVVVSHTISPQVLLKVMEVAKAQNRNRSEMIEWGLILAFFEGKPPG